MIPSMAAKYRLRTPEDIGLAERFLAAAKKAGWLDTQAHGVLRFYATLAPALESGKITPNDALTQLWDFGALQNIPEEHRAPLMQWHETTSDYLDSHDGNLPALARPIPEEARKELAEIDRVFREEPANYWKDELMQGRKHDLLSLTRGEAKPLAKASPANIKRLGDLERMMGNPASPYWHPRIGPALQAEYRNILNMGAPDSVSNRPAAAVSPQASGRRAEIEKLMGNQGSAY